MLGSSQSDPNHVEFYVECYQLFLGLKSFRIGSSRILGSYELRSFRVSGHLNTDRVLSYLISSNLKFQVISNRSGLVEFFCHLLF
jgi:hypothetical protein